MHIVHLHAVTFPVSVGSTTVLPVYSIYILHSSHMLEYMLIASPYFPNHINVDKCFFNILKKLELDFTPQTNLQNLHSSTLLLNKYLMMQYSA